MVPVRPVFQRQHQMRMVGEKATNQTVQDAFIEHGRDADPEAPDTMAAHILRRTPDPFDAVQSTADIDGEAMGLGASGVSLPLARLNRETPSSASNCFKRRLTAGWVTPGGGPPRSPSLRP